MKRIAATFFSLLCLAGCLNYEQHTVLEEDGSGSMSIHYWISEQMFMWMKDGTLSFNEDSVRLQYTADGITIRKAHTESVAADSSRHVWVSLEFDDITLLSECRGFEKLDFIWQREGDVYRFEQSLPAASESDEAFLDEYSFTYSYEFSGRVRETNADSVDGNTAIWVFPLSQMDSDLTLTAMVEATSGGSVLWVVGIMAAVLILIFVTHLLRRRRG